MLKSKTYIICLIIAAPCLLSAAACPQKTSSFEAETIQTQTIIIGDQEYSLAGLPEIKGIKQCECTIKVQRILEDLPDETQEYVTRIKLFDQTNPYLIPLIALVKIGHNPTKLEVRETETVVTIHQADDYASHPLIDALKKRLNTSAE